MAVKVCPNCSAENRPESEKCNKCDWSLAEVKESEGRGVQAPVPGAAMPSAPARQGSSAGIIILVLIILAGAGFAGWWFFLKGGGGPEATVEKFIASAKAGDFEGLKSTLSKGSASFLAMMPGGEKAMMESMKKDDTMANVKVGKATFEGDNAIVPVEDPSKKSSGMDTGSNDLVLIKEDGQWKIDFMATSTREMKKMTDKMKGMMPGGPGGPPRP